MNREIKFRCWELIEKKMNYNPYWSERINLFFTKTQFWITMQFTGLKDNNGKEIYEGDILRVNKDDKILGYVKFMKGCFFLQSNNQFKDYNCFDEFKEEQFEVIGNIYENQELLKCKIEKSKGTGGKYEKN